MTRKILMSECGVDLIEDDELDRLFMTLDGFSCFPSGVSTKFKDMMLKSYKNIVEIRRQDGYK